MAKFHIKNEVPNRKDGQWRLYFQWGFYDYGGEEIEYGYRFIWRRPDGSLQARPARIPSAKELEKLIELATKAGWYKNVEENINE